MNAFGDAQHQALIRGHLEHLLASPQFTGAPKLASFLRFVVESSLAGKSEQVKESLIAVEVYGRRPDYNPQIDSTVRVEAGRLRVRLKQYYESYGQDQPFEIELPKGGYIPVIRGRAVQSTGTVAAEPEPLLPVKVRWRWWVWALPVLAGFVICGIAIGVQLAKPTPRQGQPKPAAPAARLTPSDGETSRLYLRAHELLRIPVLKFGPLPEVPATVYESVRLFEEVTHRDERFAPGWVGLAEANEWLYELDRHHPPERLRAARAAAERAVELDPKLPEGWTVLTSVLFFREWDIPAAEAACRRAVDLNPRDVLAQQRLVDLLRLQGRSEEASQAVDRALSLSPSVPNHRNSRARLLFDEGRFEDAIAEAAAAEQLNPNRQQMAYSMSLWIQAAAHQRQGRFAEAEAIYRKACANQAHDRYSEPSLGHLLAVTGRVREARSILSELERQLSLGCPRQSAIALLHAGLGNKQEALRWLERAYAERSSGVLFVGLDWRFDDLRSEPTYSQLLSRINRTVHSMNTLARVNRARLLTARP
jgi:tetratricopeptide (TPR) repeat protein